MLKHIATGCLSCKLLVQQVQCSPMSMSVCMITCFIVVAEYSHALQVSVDESAAGKASPQVRVHCYSQHWDWYSTVPAHFAFHASFNKQPHGSSSCMMEESPADRNQHLACLRARDTELSNSPRRSQRQREHAFQAWLNMMVRLRGLG